MNNLLSSFLGPYAQSYNKIALIGMSGLGKSYWSKVLEAKGYKRFCCDNLIADQLLASCSNPEGKIGCLGQWMGMPTDPDYKSKENTYLQTEVLVLEEIIAFLKQSPMSEKVVIDTTGSAPYAGEAIMKRLKKYALVLHLAISDDAIDAMLKKYIQSPRPILWGNIFHQKPHETATEAMERSYNKLLRYREALYRKYSHHSIPYELHRI